jgi:hypothetical protein
MTTVCLVRQHTEQGAADHGLRPSRGGDHCTHGLRSTKSTLLNEQDTLDGDEAEA